MFDLEIRGEIGYIVEHDAQLGRLTLAMVRNVPGAIERVRYLVDAANRDEERLVQQGVAVVKEILNDKERRPHSRPD